MYSPIKFLSSIKLGGIYANDTTEINEDIRDKIDAIIAEYNVERGDLGILSNIGLLFRELEVDFNLELKKMIQFEKNRQLRQFSSIYYKKIKNNSEIYEN